MRFNYIKAIILGITGLSVAAATSTLSASETLSVTASMDSSWVQMGRISSLKVVVDQPEGFKGQFPLLTAITESGVYPVCNDSVELRSPDHADTVMRNGRMRIIFSIPVQAFDSGEFVIPPLVYGNTTDSASTRPIKFKVVPVQAKADDAIGDYAGTADPEEKGFFDWIPDWIIDFWWIGVILILLLFALFYAIKRKRTHGYLFPKKPVPTPYEEAMTSLRDLNKRQLWQHGEEKEFFTELTDILRRYLRRGFGITAGEMTSREIISAMASNPVLQDKRKYFKDILNLGDIVKFAKVRPLPEDNEKAFNSALQFVKETKPAEPETSGKNAGKGGKK